MKNHTIIVNNFSEAVRYSIIATENGAHVASMNGCLLGIEINMNATEAQRKAIDNAFHG